MTLPSPLPGFFRRGSDVSNQFQLAQGMVDDV